MLTGIFGVAVYIYRQQGMLSEVQGSASIYQLRFAEMEWRQSPVFTIDLPNDIEKRLLILAMHKGRTVQFCAREAILDYIDEVEERFLAIDRISEEETVDNYDLLD